QCGSIIRAKFCRLSIKFLKGSWKSKNAKVRTRKAREPCHRFQNQLVKAMRGLCTILLVRMVGTSRVKASRGHNPDMGRKLRIRKAGSENEAVPCVFQIEG